MTELILAFLLGTRPNVQPTIASETLEVLELAQSVWQLFASPQGDFEILMPGVPSLTPVVTTTVGNLPVSIEGFVIQRYDNTVQYLVTRIDLPEELNTEEVEPDRLLAAMQNQIVQQTGGQVLQEGTVMLDNYPGRELKLETLEGDRTYVITNRLYWVDRKLYQISVTVPQDIEPSLAGSSAGFLDSFKLVQR
ncbi:MAG: hypothetical protein SW833_19015 [Cyanobacteriota bacterium]|nr:hypothetical protein [Cyanobacteriota bacterium]